MQDFDDRHCRVCGYLPEDPPWGTTGDLPSFEICPCCGVEWGYEDSGFQSTQSFRSRWIAKGAPWTDRRAPKDGRSTEQRLQHAWIDDAALS